MSVIDKLHKADPEALLRLAAALGVSRPVCDCTRASLCHLCRLRVEARVGSRVGMGVPAISRRQGRELFPDGL